MDLSFLINVVIGILIVSMIFSVMNQRNPDMLKKQDVKKGNRRYEQVRAVNRKSDDALLGRRFTVPRENRESVRVNLYEISSEQPTPVVYVVHGGNLFDGDVDQTDSFCYRMSQQWECMIVSINYTKLDMAKPPYQQDEIIDTVEYFSSRSTFYHIDPSRSAMVGFSGGAYLMMGASAILGTKGMNIRGLIAFYPICDDSLVQLVDQGILRTPVTFVTCDNENENRMVETVRDHMEKAGMDVEVRNYSDAKTGFIEVNNPEYEDNPNYRRSDSSLFTDDQKDYARACEIWMGGVLERYFESDSWQNEEGK